MRSVILEVHAILYELYRYGSAPDARTLGYISAAESYIEAHIAEELTPSILARELHISYSHLSRLCRSALGQTLSEVIRGMRLNLAEELLRTEPELTVTECAMRVGYSSVAYFIRQFRESKGMTPGELRGEFLRQV